MVVPFWILSTRLKLPHTTVNIPTMFHEVWWKRSNCFKKSPFFYFHGNCGKVCPTDSDFFLAYLVSLDVDVTGNITAKLCEVWSEFNIFCTLVTMATTTILNLFNPKSFAHYGGYSYKASWSLMKGIQIVFKSPLYCVIGNCGKVCPTDSDLFGLSRSTRCECCSYQISSLSVRRVTCYDHFCVFQFFSILAVSIATAAILKKINP